MANAPVRAGPTKRFFVQMLTRDIDLDDAILDLLDNCVDGILRDRRGKSDTGSLPYKGYRAHITTKPGYFQIEDNCGGIPRDVATRSAFMLGRPGDDQDADLETVGMYGIGMKRAIFKMGSHAIVTSSHDTSKYQVEITPEWLADEGNWQLELIDIPELRMASGTKIRIEKLFPNISEYFDEENSSFIQNLRTKISELFSLIIEKGFEIKVNSEAIRPVDLHLFAPNRTDFWDESLIPPYVFDGTVKGVSVFLAVGFYRPLATEAELENEKRLARGRSQAGWTVICNDRVVLHADTSAITGWGQSDVPRFHNQFISIAGVVVFRGKNAWSLPLNTTKRGLDTSSDVYLFAKNYMMEGMKKFTDFTNWWKTVEEETTPAFERMMRVDPQSLAKTIPPKEWQEVRKARSFGGEARRFSPSLPRPESKERNRRISYSRPEAQIKAISELLFDHPDANPSEVGGRCFDIVYEDM